MIFCQKTFLQLLFIFKKKLNQAGVKIALWATIRNFIELQLKVIATLYLEKNRFEYMFLQALKEKLRRKEFL